jgi:hypothetical protein
MFITEYSSSFYLDIQCHDRRVSCGLSALEKPGPYLTGSSHGLKTCRPCFERKAILEGDSLPSAEVSEAAKPQSREESERASIEARPAGAQGVMRPAHAEPCLCQPCKNCMARLFCCRLQHSSFARCYDLPLAVVHWKHDEFFSRPWSQNAWDAAGDLEGG